MNNARPRLKKYTTTVEIEAKPADTSGKTLRESQKFIPSIEKMMKAISTKSGINLKFQFGGKREKSPRVRFIVVGYQKLFNLERTAVHRLLDGILDTKLEEDIEKVELTVRKGGSFLE